MKQRDKDLLSAYNNGWDNGHKSNCKIPCLYDELERIAFKIGALDYQYGDDVEGLDYQTDQEILQHIKKKYESECQKEK